MQADRIRKLLALADSTTFPHEAMMAREKAEELLALLPEAERMQIQHARALKFCTFATIVKCPDGHYKVNWRTE